MDERGLSEFSRSVARALLGAFPEWSRYAVVDQDAGMDPGSLRLEVPAPADPAGNSLLVSTHNEEVTVSFGMFHTHFEWPEDDDHPGGALGFIRDLVSDRVLIADRVENSRWVGSETLEPSEEPERAGDQQIFIRSWSGKLDRQL